MNAARLARRWAEAGNDQLRMAEALADELTEDLATKADLAATAAELRTEMQSLRAEIHSAKADTIKWFAGLLLVHAMGVIGLTAGLVRLLAAG